MISVNINEVGDISLDFVAYIDAGGDKFLVLVVTVTVEEVFPSDPTWLLAAAAFLCFFP